MNTEIKITPNTITYSSKWRKHVPSDLAKPRVSYFRSFTTSPYTDILKSRLTWCVATVEHEGVAYVGISKCHEEDSFSRKKGKSIAVGRATHMLGMHIAVDGLADLRDSSHFPELAASTFLAADKVKPFIVRLRALEKTHEDLDGEIALFLSNPEGWEA